MADIIIGGIVLIIVALVVAYLAKNKKAGKSSCGCDCGSCGAGDICHPQSDDEEKKSK